MRGKPTTRPAARWTIRAQRTRRRLAAPLSPEARLRRWPLPPVAHFWSRGGAEQGSLSVEAAVLLPLVLVLTFTIIQGGLWFHATSLCQGAAQAAVRAGRVIDAPAGTGANAGMAYLSSVGGGALTSPTLTETRTATTLTATCVATAPMVVPVAGLDLTVRESSQAQLERFTTR